MSERIGIAKQRLPLPSLMQQLGLGEHAKKSARCPFHDDKHNSFSVWQKDGAWIWKCHAGCGAGDEIHFLERHKGISRSDAITLFREMAGCAASTQARESNNGRRQSFNWQQCVSALEPPRIDPLGNGNSHLVRLGNERWYSRAFCSWLHETKLVGVYNGCIAFPLHDRAATVVGAHYCLEDGSWRYTPTGAKTAPLVIGDLAVAKQVHLGESQWDMFALADRTDWYKEKSVAFVATRGAANGKMVAGLIPQSASVLAWPQNDKASEKWLGDVATHAGVPVAQARTPMQFKDVNEWTMASPDNGGARPEDIFAAFWRNELVYEPPKPKSVDLTVLLEDVCAFLKRFVVFTSEAQPIAIALWVAHTWTIDAFDYTPYLHIVSPEKRCGKSRLLDCLELVAADPWRVVSPTEAVLFRKIESGRTSLLLDEVDAIFSGGKDDSKEPLRALLNAGFERSSTVPRCVPPAHEIRNFRVFCPKAFAGIGKLPDTITDRCIPIRLIRRSRNESVQRFRKREAEEAIGSIRAGLTEWVRGDRNIENLRAARPDVPLELGDRQADICEPLLAIAELAGGEWPERARSAFVTLCNEGEEDESIGVKLLFGTREAFEATGTDRLPTKQLLEVLVDQETDAPWAGWWEHDLQNNNARGPAQKLARLLKPHGIKAKVIRLPDGTTPRGYIRADFEDVWKRYCPPKTA